MNYGGEKRLPLPFCDNYRTRCSFATTSFLQTQRADTGSPGVESPGCLFPIGVPTLRAYGSTIIDKAEEFLARTPELERLKWHPPSFHKDRFWMDRAVMVLASNV
ncbi:MAG: hypothetical protein KGS49_19500, partial [Planctomycetes bacterium]|nr:hypothetical protein [Planctomycetota bacterium]